jgi:CheY-like chemotaxis protein
MSSALTVLLANDDPAVSDAFRDAAARDPAVQLAVTTDAIEMIELAQQLRPDAIICASKLSGIDGL